MEIEEAVSRLTTLAGNPTLSKSEHAEVKKIMASLKKAGLSNAQISKFGKGRWSESTIKGYVKGIRSAAQSPWQDAVGLLDSLINAGVTLDEVELAVAVFKDLKSSDVEVSEVVEFLEAADSASLNVKTLIKQHEAVKASGISVKEAGDILNLKQKLEQNGLGLDSLAALAKLAEKYGHPQKVIEAVSQYVSLAELKEETAAVKGQLESAKEKLASVQQQLQQVGAQLAQFKKPLEAYKKANVLGFGEAELTQLSALGNKYGGVKKMLQAIDAYADYAQINHNIAQAKVTLDVTKVNIGKLESEWGHLKTAITMCDTLIHHYKFGLDAIATIFSVAKKYGEPVDVLKGVELYGKLGVLQEELGKMEGKIAERKAHIAKLQGEYSEALSQLESLTARALKIGAEVGKVEAQLAGRKNIERLMNLINEPALVSYSEYGPLVVAVSASIRKFVIAHEQKFKFPSIIKTGFDALLKELGGA